MGKNNEDHLKGKILFFSPNDEGASYFTDSLIYMCDHNSNGSLGLIVNRPLNLKLDDLFKGLKIRETKTTQKCFSWRSSQSRCNFHTSFFREILERNYGSYS